MTTHLAFLRGVNLGPTRRIKMADLRVVISGAGFAEVRTYLQSGNVVVSSSLSPAAVATTMRDAISAGCGLSTDVIVRSAAQLRKALDADPLSDVATDPARHVLGLMADRASADAVQKLSDRIDTLPSDGDRYAFGDKHFYLWCPNGISKSPFFKVNWDKLGVSSTQRNWNTVTAMLDLAADT